MMIPTRFMTFQPSPLHFQPDSISHSPYLPPSGYVSHEDEEFENDLATSLSDHEITISVPFIVDSNMSFNCKRNSSHKKRSLASVTSRQSRSLSKRILSKGGIRIPLKTYNQNTNVDGIKFITQESGTKHQVYVCVVFLKIGEIDTIKEQYAADVLIKSKWREPILDNNTNHPEYDWTNSWSPKLYIENTIGEAKEHVYHMITFNEFNHAFLCEKRRVSGVFLENLELNHFPFDVQDLTITVASNLPTSEIRLVNDPDESHRINKQSFVDEQEWYLYKHIETEQRELAYEYTDPATVRPALSVKCRAARRPAYFIWNIFLVTFLICSLSLVTFAVDKALPQNRLQLTYTLVLTLVAFKFVVNQCLPKISYLTYLDKYVISSLFILTLICLWHGLIVVIEKVSARLHYQLPDDMEVYVIIGMAVSYVGYNVAFVVMIYSVACRRRRDMKQRDKEYVEKVQCQMKYKGMRAMRMIQQTHQLHEVKENGNATFI